ncbi:unnamed protein product, partial [Brassica rapa]
MRINSPLRLCHVCGPLMDPAHLLSVNFKTHALKGRVVDTENGISRSVENTERKRKALGRERVTATQRPIGASVAIKCHTGYKSRSKWIDDLGEFEINLPSQLQ